MVSVLGFGISLLVKELGPGSWYELVIGILAFGLISITKALLNLWIKWKAYYWNKLTFSKSRKAM